jgi:hypothetical protein
MHPLAIFLTVFLYTAILWGVVLYLYDRFFEPFDFGNFPIFLGKSVLLIFLVSLCGLHFIGVLLSLFVWWGGIMFLFQKDFWQCRVLVLLLYGLFFATSILIAGYIIEAWKLSLEIG